MGLFSKGLSQKDKYLIQAKSANESLEFYMKQFKDKNKTISECTNIIDAILIIFEELYKITPYIKNEFEIDPNNFEDFKIMYLNKLRDLIDDRKQEILEKYNKSGELRYYSQLVNLNDEIKQAQKSFPEYSDYLKNDDIEKIISEGE